MGIRTTTATHFECDICRREVPESRVFRSRDTTLWSDRDVTATLYLSLRVEVSYVTNNGVICKDCATSNMRRIADEIEKESQQ
ncbi:hypothetical protein D3C87_792610 [compost metagenome]